MGRKNQNQERQWDTIKGVDPNQKIKRFQDPRVRQALGYALDRWGTIKYLSKIAIVKTVGGLVFPGHRLEAKKEWLMKLPGYGADIKAARAKAKTLLKEAGYPNLKVTLWNRAADQPDKTEPNTRE